MILLYLKGALQLDDPANLIRTVFEVSDTRNFSNIISRSDSDVNKYAVMFNIELDPSKKYYARSRCLLTTGWTHYSNLDYIEVKLSGLTGYINSVLPSKISTPILSTNSLQNKHDVTNFRIQAIGFDRVGLSKHNKTIYFITDENNNVVWYKVSDTDLNEIEVNNIILLENKLYKIHAIFGSSTNDFSQIASMTILTGQNKNINYLSSKNMTLGIDYKIKVQENFNINSIEIKLSKVNETVETVLESTINSFEYIIPKEIIKEGIYLIQIKSNLDDSYKNIVLQTNITGLYNNSSNYLTVEDGETLTIENPSSYDRIKVKKGGYVILKIKDEYVKLGWDVLIITRDTRMTYEEFEAEGYTSVYYVGTNPSLELYSS